MNELEAANMEAMKKELSGSIKKGIEFANQGTRAWLQHLWLLFWHVEDNPTPYARLF